MATYDPSNYMQIITKGYDRVRRSNEKIWVTREFMNSQLSPYVEEHNDCVLPTLESMTTKYGYCFQGHDALIRGSVKLLPNMLPPLPQQAQPVLPALLEHHFDWQQPGFIASARVSEDPERPSQYLSLYFTVMVLYTMLERIVEILGGSALAARIKNANWSNGGHRKFAAEERDLEFAVRAFLSQSGLFSFAYTIVLQNNGDLVCVKSFIPTELSFTRTPRYKGCIVMITNSKKESSCSDGGRSTQLSAIMQQQQQQPLTMIQTPLQTPVQPQQAEHQPMLGAAAPQIPAPSGITNAAPATVPGQQVQPMAQPPPTAPSSSAAAVTPKGPEDFASSIANVRAISGLSPDHVAKLKAMIESDPVASEALGLMMKAQTDLSGIVDAQLKDQSHLDRVAAVQNAYKKHTGRELDEQGKGMLNAMYTSSETRDIFNLLAKLAVKDCDIVNSAKEESKGRMVDPSSAAERKVDIVGAPAVTEGSVGIASFSAEQIAFGQIPVGAIKNSAPKVDIFDRIPDRRATAMNEFIKYRAALRRKVIPGQSE